MPRRKTIPASIDTQYFADVTPLWRPPHEQPIPERYHDAVYALAEWAGPDWSRADLTGFFLIRQVIISSCEAWNVYDWEADASWIKERKIDAARAADLERSVSKLANILITNQFRRCKLDFIGTFLSELNIEPPNDLSKGAAISALDRTIEWIVRRTQLRDRFPSRYGSIEYDNLPDRLPRKEGAIALSLADRITFFRKDGHAKGSLQTPHPPNLSPNLPWKAISLFASANCAEESQEIAPSNIQTRVEKLASNVARIYWS